MQKILGIEPIRPADIAAEYHQHNRFCKHMWTQLLGYVTGVCLRNVCTASQTLRDVGETFYSDAFGRISKFRRNYMMAFPIVPRHLCIHIDPDDKSSAKRMHGCRHTVRCCAWTVNGSRCGNTTRWDGCYGPLCAPHRYSQGIVPDGGLYKDIEFDTCSWYPKSVARD